MGWTSCPPHGYSSTYGLHVNPMGDTYCQPHGELNLTILYVHSMGDTNRPPHGVFQSVSIIVNPMGDTDVTKNLGPFRYLLPLKQRGYDLTGCSWLSTAWVISLTLTVSPMGRFCVVNIRCHTQGCYVLQSRPRRLHFKSKTEQHGQDQCLQLVKVRPYAEEEEDVCSVVLTATEVRILPHWELANSTSTYLGLGLGLG